jgi:hypothetical protein
VGHGRPSPNKELPMTDTIYLEYKQFMNEYGLVDQKPGSTSHNSLTEHALYLMALDRLGPIEQHVIDDTKAKVYKYQIERGLYARWPGDRTNLESVDDYHALSVISKLVDPVISQDILKYAREHNYYVNNTLSFDKRAFFMWYQHQIVVMHKISAGEKLNCVDREWVYWVLRMTDMQQDSLKLTSMLRFVAGDISKTVKYNFINWEMDFAKAYPNGLGQTLDEYYNKGPDELTHPNKRWLHNYFGRKDE